uniref:CUE domain-containing protein n=1 Tax=Rhabditophanes sp. KR3021 TaxID=114890 RepID=A0AC35TM67_9BILA
MSGHTNNYGATERNDEMEYHEAMNYFCAMFPGLPRSVIEITARKRNGIIDLMLEDLLKYSEKYVNNRKEVNVVKNDTSNDEAIARMMQNEEFRRFAAADREFRDVVRRDRMHESSSSGSGRISERENYILPVPNGPAVDYSDSSIPNGPMMSDSSSRSRSFTTKISDKIKNFRKQSSSGSFPSQGPVPMYEQEHSSYQHIDAPYEYENEFKNYQNPSRVKEMGKASKDKIMKLMAKFKANQDIGKHYDY